MLKRTTILRLSLFLVIWFTAGCVGTGTGYRDRPVPPLQSNDPYAHLQMAQKYFSMFLNEDSHYLENLDIVIRESNEALRLSPQMAEAYYLLGYGKAFKGILTNDEIKIQKGLSAFNLSIERKPSLGNAGTLFPLPFMAAKYYLEKNETSKAIRYVQEAIRLNPDIMEPHVFLGSIYSNQEKHKLALQEYRTAADLSPENPEVAGLVAMTYSLIIESAASKKNVSLYKNVVTKAITATKRAVLLNPDDAAIHEVLGLLYGAAGFYDLKLFEFQVVIEQDESASAYVELGNAYLGKNLLPKAEQSYLKALEIDPDSGPARFCLAYSHYLMDDNEKACEIFNQHFKSTEAPNAYRAIWYYYSILSLGNRSQAKDFLKKYSRSFSGDQWEKDLLDYHLGKYDDASLAAKALQSFDKCEAYYYIGCRHFHNGEKEQARQWFQKALQTKIYDYYEYFAANSRLDQLNKNKGGHPLGKIVDEGEMKYVLK